MDTVWKRKQIITEFKKLGLVLREGSLRLLEQYLQDHQDILKQKVEQVLLMVRQIQSDKPELYSDIIGEEIMKDAIQTIVGSKRSINNGVCSSVINQNGNIQEQKYSSCLIVLGLSDVGQIQYSQKGMVSISYDQQKGLMSDAAQKSVMYRERFANVKQSIKKKNCYVFVDEQKTELQIDDEDSFMIKSVGSLLGSEGNCMAFGIVSELNHNQYQLEDEQHKVILNFQGCDAAKGFIVVGNIVIVEGVYTNKTIKVDSIYLPAFTSRSEFDVVNNVKQNEDYFGCKAKLDKYLGKIIGMENQQQQIEKQQIEQFLANNQKQLGIYDIDKNQYLKEIDKQELGVIVMNGVEFDNKVFLNKFEQFIKLSKQYQLNNGFIILSGDFFPSKISKQELQIYINNFLNIIDDKKLINAYWLLVPSVKCGTMRTLPKRGIPQFIFEMIQHKLPNSVNLWNPSRMSILGSEFIVSNNECYKYLRKHSVVEVDGSLKNHEHYINSILCQQHLCPVEMFSQPVYWDYDFLMQIARLPHFLVICDPFCARFNVSLENDSHVINPGDFTKNSEFVIIYPMQNKVLEQKLPSQ